MKKVFKLTFSLTLLFLISGFNSIKEQNNNNCESLLKVIGNQYNKSILPNRDVSYNLELKNISNKAITYLISSKELEESCIKDTRQKESLKGNAKLNSQIIFENSSKSKENKELVIQPGKSFMFKAVFKLPKNTLSEKWNCTEVIVTSKECNTTVASVVLKTYVQNTSLR